MKDYTKSATAGVVLYALGLFGSFGMLSHLNPHSDAPAVKQNIAIRETLRELKYERNRVEEITAKLPYMSEQMKPFVDNVFSAKDKTVLESLDNAIKLAEADLQKSDQLPDVVACNKFYERSAYFALSSMVLGTVLIGYSMLRTAAERRKSNQQIKH